MVVAFEFEHRIDYSPIRGQYRPLIYVVFKHDDEEHGLSMLVDTGADDVVLPASFGQLLGLDLTQCRTANANTYNGVRQVFVGPQLEFCVPQLGDDNKTVSCTVCFTQHGEDWGYGLLGRQALDKMRFCFTHKHGHSFWMDYSA